MGLLLAIDPIVDMGRTALNVAGQALVPTVVARRGAFWMRLYNAPRSEGSFVAQNSTIERIAGEGQRLHEGGGRGTPLIWQPLIWQRLTHTALRRYRLAPWQLLRHPCLSMGKIHLSNVIKVSLLILFSLTIEKSYDFERRVPSPTWLRGWDTLFRPLYFSAHSPAS